MSRSLPPQSQTVTLSFESKHPLIFNTHQIMGK